MGEQVSYAGGPENPVASSFIFVDESISIFFETCSFETGKSHVTVA